MASVRTRERKTRRREKNTLFWLPRFPAPDDKPPTLKINTIFIYFALVVFLSSTRPPKTGGAFFEGGVFLLVSVVRLEPLIRVRFFSIYAQARPLALPSHVWGGWARMCLGMGRRVGAVPLQREKGNLKCTKHSQKPKSPYMCTLKCIKIHNFIHFCIKFIHFDMHMHHFNNTPEPK